MAYRDEDSIWEQINEKGIFLAFYYEDLKMNNFRKCICKEIQQVTHKFGFSTNPILYAYEK